MLRIILGVSKIGNGGRKKHLPDRFFQRAGDYQTECGDLSGATEGAMTACWVQKVPKMD